MTTLKWDTSKPVAKNAANNLPELARQFFASGREADKSFAALHRFRLMTKRFRYVLDMFSRYYGPELERRLDELQKLQQLLGEISDVAATQELLAPREDLPSAKSERLRGKLDRMADVRRSLQGHRDLTDQFADRQARAPQIAEQTGEDLLAQTIE